MRRKSHRKGNSRVSYKRTKTKSRNKKYIKSNKKGKYIFVIIIFLLTIVYLYKVLPDAIYIKTGLDEYDDERIKELIREVLEENEELSETEAEEIVIENIEQGEKKEQNSEKQITSRGSSSIRKTTSLGNFQITSYHPGDDYLSGTRTGSGKTTSDFETMKIGNKDVYTYEGKIVVACATEELLASGYNVKGGGTRQEGKHYFEYYDTGKLNIDGNWYEFIVLDSCGAAMWLGEKRIDIYVPSSDDIVNRSSAEAVI